jgi:glycosyltransferase involved in cell wall biosynthesis
LAITELKLSKTPKILIITARADFGGGPEHIFRLVQKLKDEIEYYIACPDDYPYKKRYSELVTGSRIIIIPHRKFALKELYRLRTFIKEKGIELIHSHGKGAGIYSRLLSFITSIPTVHTFHGIHIGSYNSAQKIIYLLLEKFLSIFTKRFISVSKSEFQKVISSGITRSSKISIIENAVRVPQNIIPDDNFYAEKKNIVTITRFDYAKNSLLLIPVFEKLKTLINISQFEIIVLGSGKDAEKLKEKSVSYGSENIFSLKGFVDNPSDYLSTSFCYISTSRWEAMPLGVMEAMALGIPVVATDVTGNSDLVEHDKTGFLFDINNPNQAAEFLAQLSKDFNLWKKLSLASKERIEKNFSLAKMAAETKSLYMEIIEDAL